MHTEGGNNLKRRNYTFILALLLLFVCTVPAMAVQSEITVLFTHDLHSHFLPQPDTDGGSYGGYARLAVAINAERAAAPAALLLDGGDFSIGSLIQTLYMDYAAELTTMGQIGYDAATIGNHEFDHKGAGFARMLRSAKASGKPVPPLLVANYKPQDSDVQAAMDEYGITESMLLSRGGITYGIFGLMGEYADACAPTSGFVREAAEAAAKRCVERLKAEGADIIVCLSHSGTDPDADLSEDKLLAEAVAGIDVIVSGHTHTTLYEPKKVNNTFIVSVGAYCRNLGVLKFTHDENGNTLKEYRLVPIDESLEGDAAIAQTVEELKKQVGETYLSRYNLTYDQVLTESAFAMNAPSGSVQEGNSIGELVADSFLWAVENLEVNAPNVPTLTVTANGVLRASLIAGELTTSNAFDVLSMGVGSDGTSGFPLVEVYLTGKEVKAAIEVDASVTPIMNDAQLYMSGVKYSFNVNRMFFNRLTEAYIYEPWWANGNEAQGLAAIENDRLYRVVTGMYSAQMLGTVKSKSLGLLSLEPKYADGTPIKDFDQCILRDKNGNEIKEWYALAAYLQSFGAEGVPARYAGSDGRKEVSHSWNPIQILRSPNWLTLAAATIILLLLFALFLIMRSVCRRIKRHNRKQ